ncbi:MAG: sulfotransferase family protein [Pseudomonadota bacterium]
MIQVKSSKLIDMALLRSLLGSGRYHEAVAELVSLLDQQAVSRDALALLKEAFNKYRCFSEITDVILAWLETHQASFVLLELLVDGYAHLGEMSAARVTFSKLLEKISTPSQVSTAIKHVPALFQVTARYAVYQELLTLLNCEAMQQQPIVAVLEARILLMLAMGNIQQFNILINRARISGITSVKLKKLYAMEECLRTFNVLGSTSQKVFGIGLSKTGTTTLHEALSQLGLQSAHWTNSMTGQLLGDDDIPLFDALSDTSISYRFEELYYAFPSAYFIYTHRSFSGWEKSLLKHFSGFKWGAGMQTFDELKRHHQELTDFRYGDEWKNIHDRLYFNHASLADAYKSFDQRVRSFFADKPNAHFLALDIVAGQGWSELCPFLNKPIPEKPFPWKYKSLQVYTT